MENRDITQSLFSGQSLGETQASTAKAGIKTLDEKVFFSLLSKKLRQPGLERSNGKMFIPISALKHLKPHKTEPTLPEMKLVKRAVLVESGKQAEQKEMVFGGMFSLTSLRTLEKVNVNEFIADIKTNIMPRTSQTEQQALGAFIKNSSNVQQTTLEVLKVISKLSAKNPSNTITLPAGDQIKISMHDQVIDIQAPITTKPVLDKALKVLQLMMGKASVSDPKVAASTQHLQAKNLTNTSQKKRIDAELTPPEMLTNEKKSILNTRIENASGTKINPKTSFAKHPSSQNSALGKQSKNTTEPKINLNKLSDKSSLYQNAVSKNQTTDTPVTKADSQKIAGDKFVFKSTNSNNQIKNTLSADKINQPTAVLEKQHLREKASSSNLQTDVHEIRNTKLNVTSNTIKNVSITADKQTWRTTAIPSNRFDTTLEVKTTDGLQTPEFAAKSVEPNNGRIIQIRTFYTFVNSIQMAAKGSTRENDAQPKSQKSTEKRNSKNSELKGKLSKLVPSSEQQHIGTKSHVALKNTHTENAQQERGTDKPLVHDWIREADSNLSAKPSANILKENKAEILTEQRTFVQNAKNMDMAVPMAGIKTQAPSEVFKTILRPMQNLQTVIEQYLKLKPGKFSANRMRIDSSSLGELEVRFKANGDVRHMTIVVESEMAKVEIQKLLPAIQSGLVDKGFPFQQINVDLGQAGAKQFKKENEKHKSTKQTNTITKEESNDTTPTVIHQKKFGYNTVEYVA